MNGYLNRTRLIDLLTLFKRASDAQAHYGFIKRGIGRTGTLSCTF